MIIEKILIADDELLIRNFLAEALARKGYEVTVTENGKKALSAFKQNPCELVITDMKMPEMGGLELLTKIKEISPQTLVIVITAFGTIENAVEAMSKGAFHYLLKPFTPECLEVMIKKAYEHLALVQENAFLKEKEKVSHKIIATSPQMQTILAEVKRVAKSHATILINGESGTGKEVIAQAIHAFSQRATKPFIKVNCAAIPDTLIESEFFGHEKGAFTGALQKRMGRFERADKGTLLLDEVSEIPLALQAKLLRVVQEQEFERVGGTEAIHIDVRLVSTSNREMKEAINEKTFRADLYYRLNVIPIYLPPLRERKEDILPLAHHFLVEVCQRDQIPLKIFSKKAEEKLLNYSWPGNIRELRNVIEHGVVMDYSNIIEEEHLLIDLNRSEEVLPIFTIKELEKKHILKMLDHFDGNRTQAAKALGISIRTLRNKLNEYSKA
ncbi:MAG: sigma-54-dependent Fis family transcriptional regulator [Simkania sp.]|nr:sigma-54-dependent Fis family transcriptional regulator [Simkania sp.]